jgi:hypothetical protein
MRYLFFLLLAQSASAQTTDFVDSLFNLYPQEMLYPEDVNFEVVTDSTISLISDKDQCVMQRWMHYPGTTFLLSHAPSDCADFAPTLSSIAVNNQFFSLNTNTYFQNSRGNAPQVSWFADESWHKMTLKNTNYYYTTLTNLRCNGTTCSFTLTVIFKETNNKFTPFFFYNEGADLEVIDVDHDDMPDIVETIHTDEKTGVFSALNNRTDIRWLELTAGNTFEYVNDPSGKPYLISIRYPEWEIKSMQILQHHWPDPN